VAPSKMKNLWELRKTGNHRFSTKFISLACIYYYQTAEIIPKNGCAHIIPATGAPNIPPVNNKF
jgi:hypothetical protein